MHRRRAGCSSPAAPLRTPPWPVTYTAGTTTCSAPNCSRLGGTSGEVLDDPGLRSLVLGIVRNDYRLIETYRPDVRPPLDCPIHVLTGADDPELDRERVREEAGGWADLTTARTEVRTFPGDHFYLTPGAAKWSPPSCGGWIPR